MFTTLVWGAAWWMTAGATHASYSPLDPRGEYVGCYPYDPARPPGTWRAAPLEGIFAEERHRRASCKNACAAEQTAYYGLYGGRGAAEGDMCACGDVQFGGEAQAAECGADSECAMAWSDPGTPCGSRGILALYRLPGEGRMGPAAPGDPQYELRYPTTYYPGAAAWDGFAPLSRDDPLLPHEATPSSCVDPAPPLADSPAMDGALEATLGASEEVWAVHLRELRSAAQDAADDSPAFPQPALAEWFETRVPPRAPEGGALKGARLGPKVAPVSAAVVRAGAALGLHTALDPLFAAAAPPLTAAEKFSQAQCLVDVHRQFKMRGTHEAVEGWRAEFEALEVLGAQLRASDAYEATGMRSVEWLRLLDDFNSRAEDVVRRTDAAMAALSGAAQADAIQILPHYAQAAALLQHGRVLAHAERHAWEGEEKAAEAVRHNVALMTQRRDMARYEGDALRAARGNVAVGFAFPDGAGLDEVSGGAAQSTFRMSLAPGGDEDAWQTDHPFWWPWAAKKLPTETRARPTMLDIPDDAGAAAAGLFQCEGCLHQRWDNYANADERAAPPGAWERARAGSVFFGFAGGVCERDRSERVGDAERALVRMRRMELEAYWEEATGVAVEDRERRRAALTQGWHMGYHVLRWQVGEFLSATTRAALFPEPPDWAANDAGERDFAGYHVDAAQAKALLKEMFPGVSGSVAAAGPRPYCGDGNDRDFADILEHLPFELNSTYLQEIMIPRLMKTRGVSPEYDHRLLSRFRMPLTLLETFPPPVVEHAVVRVTPGTCLTSPAFSTPSLGIPVSAAPCRYTDHQFWSVVRPAPGVVQLQALGAGGVCVGLRPPTGYPVVSRRTREVGGYTHEEAEHLVGWGMACPAGYALSAWRLVEEYTTTVLGATWDYDCRYVPGAGAAVTRTSRVAAGGAGNDYSSGFGKFGAGEAPGDAADGEAWRRARQPNCGAGEVLNAFRLAVREGAGSDGEELVYRYTCLPLGGEMVPPPPTLSANAGVCGGRGTVRAPPPGGSHYRQFWNYLGSPAPAAPTPGRVYFVQGFLRVRCSDDPDAVVSRVRYMEYPEGAGEATVAESIPCSRPASRIDALPPGWHDARVARQYHTPMHVQLQLHGRCVSGNLSLADAAAPVGLCDHWVLDGPYLRHRVHATCLKSMGDGVALAPCPVYTTDYAGAAAPDTAAREKEQALRAADAAFYWLLLEPTGDAGDGGGVELLGTGTDGAAPLSALLTGETAPLTVRVAHPPMHVVYDGRYLARTAAGAVGLVDDPAASGAAVLWEWEGHRLRVWDTAAAGKVQDVACLVVTDGPDRGLALVPGADPLCGWGGEAVGRWTFGGVWIWDKTYCVVDDTLAVQPCSDLSLEGGDAATPFVLVPEASGGEAVAHTTGRRADSSTGLSSRADVWRDYWCHRAWAELAPYTKEYFAALGMTAAAWPGGRATNACPRPALGALTAEQAAAAAHLGFFTGTGHAKDSSGGPSGPPGPPGPPGCVDGAVPTTPHPPTPVPTATPPTPPTEACDDVHASFDEGFPVSDWFVVGGRVGGVPAYTDANAGSLRLDGSLDAAAAARFSPFRPNRPMRITFYEAHYGDGAVATQVKGPGDASGLCMTLPPSNSLTQFAPRRVMEGFAPHEAAFFRYTVAFDWGTGTVDVFRTTADAAARPAEYTAPERVLWQAPLLCTHVSAVEFTAQGPAELDDFSVECHPDTVLALQHPHCTAAGDEAVLTLYPRHGVPFTANDRFAVFRADAEGNQARRCQNVDARCASAPGTCYPGRVTPTGLDAALAMVGARMQARFVVDSNVFGAGAYYLCYAGADGVWGDVDGELQVCAPPEAMRGCAQETQHEGFDAVADVSERWNFTYAWVQPREEPGAFVHDGAASLNVSHGSAMWVLPNATRPGRLSMHLGGRAGTYSFDVYMGRVEGYSAGGCLGDWGGYLNWRWDPVDPTPSAGVGVWDRYDFYLNWGDRVYNVYRRGEDGRVMTWVDLPLQCNAVDMLSFFGSGYVDAVEFDCAADQPGVPALGATIYPLCPHPHADALQIELRSPDAFNGTHIAYVVPADAGCDASLTVAHTLAYSGTWPADAAGPPPNDSRATLTVRAEGRRATLFIARNSTAMQTGKAYKACYEQRGQEPRVPYELEFTTCGRAAGPMQADVLNPPVHRALPYPAAFRGRGVFEVGDVGFRPAHTAQGSAAVASVPRWLEDVEYRYAVRGLEGGAQLVFECPGERGALLECAVYLFLRPCRPGESIDAAPGGGGCQYAHTVLARSAIAHGWVEGDCGPAFTLPGVAEPVEYTPYRKLLAAGERHELLTVPRTGNDVRVHDVLLGMDHGLHPCAAIRDAWDCTLYCRWDGGAVADGGRCVANWCPTGATSWRAPYSKVNPVPARWLAFPDDAEVRGNYSSTGKHRSQFQPRYAARCDGLGEAVGLRSRDSAPAQTGCGVLGFTRVWEVVCRRTGRQERTILARPQRFTVLPAFGLEWALAPPREIGVPYFDALQDTSLVPVLKSTEDAMCGAAVLSSNDSDVHFFAAGEGACSTQGVARFTRTWVAEDACCRRLERVQEVTILHPRLRPPVAANRYAALLLAPGVRQTGGACYAHKKVHRGRRVYPPYAHLRNASFCVDQYDCLAPGEAGVTPTAVPPVLPAFRPGASQRLQIPHRRDLDTIAPPPVSSACNISHELTRVGPTQVGAHEWRIEWHLQPRFEGCPGPYPPRFTTVHSQLVAVGNSDAPAGLAAGWCTEDADCRTLGDVGAGCALETRSCICSSDGYAAVKAAAVCAPREPGDAVTPLVVQALFPEGDCAALASRPQLRRNVVAAFAAAMGRAPVGYATTCEAGRFIASAHFEGVRVAELKGIAAIEAALAAAAAGDIDLVDAVGTARPKVLQVRAVSPAAACTAGNAVDTAFVAFPEVSGAVSASCNALRCVSGFVKTHRYGLQLCAPPDRDYAGACAADHDCTAGNGTVRCADGVCDGFAPNGTAGTAAPRGGNVTYVAADEHPWVLPALLFTVLLGVLLAGAVAYMCCQREYATLGEAEGEPYPEAEAAAGPDPGDIQFRSPDSPVLISKAEARTHGSQSRLLYTFDDSLMMSSPGSFRTSPTPRAHPLRRGFPEEPQGPRPQATSSSEMVPPQLLTPTGREALRDPATEPRKADAPSKKNEPENYSF